MVSTIRHHAAVYGCYARLTIQTQLEFPLYLASWLFLVPFHWFATAYLLKVLTQNFSSLGGWNFGELMFISGLALVSHGLTVTFFIRTWSIGEAAMRGDFDRLLVRPLNVYAQFVGSFVNLIGLFDVAPGIAILVYGCRAAGFDASPANLIKLALVIAGAVLIRVAIYTATGSVVFWTGRGRAPLLLMGHLMERATVYPVNLYPYALQLVLTLLIPLAFVSFYPACDFFGRPEAAQLPFGFALATPAAGLIALVIAYRVFQTGLMRWNSTGS